ncbi:MAG: right-handed parallel beta-helix repeat-containing protein [Phycisphaerae bacterium]|nr:right-handed parallel beta-helix repeat-containing protein [Phycisphaerae bacterium]
MKRIGTRTVVLFVLSLPLNAATIVVDQHGAGDFIAIQEAITAAWDFDTVEVNPGLYSEHINFFGKAITVKSNDPNDPNIVTNTILDGGGNGNVVTFNNAETSMSILDGFTVQNGENGIYCTGNDTQPQITRCVIHSNTNGVRGPYARPVISACTIENNSEIGIFSCAGQIDTSLIANNGGDGINDLWGRAKNCIIRQNGGRGAYNENHARGNLENCIISGNGGHGAHCVEATWFVTNCTIAGNGGSGITTYYWGRADVKNSIIAQNQAWGVVGEITLSYNNIWGNRSGPYYAVSAGPHDIHDKPWFAMPGYWDSPGTWHEGDYHLRSTKGRWDPRTQMWMTDPIDSPSIDAGDTGDQVLGELYPHGDRINQGAYGGTDEASMSEKSGPSCVEQPVMDFNRDCKVDALDLDIFMESWLQCNLDDPSACVFVQE